MATLATLGGETWFRLGDRDLAAACRAHAPPAPPAKRCPTITDDCARRSGVGARMLPMSDDPVRTRLQTDEGWLDFQDYFVHRRCEPVGARMAFHGAATARAQPGFLAALGRSGVARGGDLPVQPVHQHRADPERCRACAPRCAAARAPVVAVSPIIGGRAVKGPTAKMMAELGLDASARAVASAL